MSIFIAVLNFQLCTVCYVYYTISCVFFYLHNVCNAMHVCMYVCVCAFLSTMHLSSHDNAILHEQIIIMHMLCLLFV